MNSTDDSVRPTDSESSDTSLPSTNTILLGTIVEPRGLRGELRLRLANPLSNTLTKGLSVRLSNHAAAKTLDTCVLAVHTRGNFAILALKAIDSRNSAEAWVGSVLTIDKASLPILAKGEYYWFELVHCSILGRDGTAIGRVERVEGELQQRLIFPYKEKVVELPFVLAFIERVDLPTRTIVLTEAGDNFLDAYDL